MLLAESKMGKSGLAVGFGRHSLDDKCSLLSQSPDLPIFRSFPNPRFPPPLLLLRFLLLRFLPHRFPLPFPLRFLLLPLRPRCLLLLPAQNLACPRCSRPLVKRRPALSPLFRSVCRPPGLALFCSAPPGLSSRRPAPAG